MRCPSDPVPHTHPTPAGAIPPCATCPTGPACPFFGPASLSATH